MSKHFQTTNSKRSVRPRAMVAGGALALAALGASLAVWAGSSSATSTTNRPAPPAHSSTVVPAVPVRPTVIPAVPVRPTVIGRASQAHRRPGRAGHAYGCPGGAGEPPGWHSNQQLVSAAKPRAPKRRRRRPSAPQGFVPGNGALSERLSPPPSSPAVLVKPTPPLKPTANRVGSSPGRLLASSWVQSPRPRRSLALRSWKSPTKNRECRSPTPKNRGFPLAPRSSREQDHSVVVT